MRRLLIYRDKDGTIKVKMSNKRQTSVSQPSCMCAKELSQTYTTSAKEQVQLHKLSRKPIRTGANQKCKVSAKKRAQARALANIKVRSKSYIVVRKAVGSPINNDFNNLKPVKYDIVEKNLKDATRLALSLIKR